MGINQRINEEIKAKGYTLAYVAEEAGISESTLSSWIAGTAEPTFENVEVMANVLNLTLAELTAEGKSPTSMNHFQMEMFKTWDALAPWSKRASLKFMDVTLLGAAYE